MGKLANLRVCGSVGLRFRFRKVEERRETLSRSPFLLPSVAPPEVPTTTYGDDREMPGIFFACKKVCRRRRVLRHVFEGRDGSDFWEFWKMIKVKMI